MVNKIGAKKKVVNCTTALKVSKANQLALPKFKGCRDIQSTMDLGGEKKQDI